LVVTAITVLLRSLTRICDARAALVAIDGTDTVLGAAGAACDEPVDLLSTARSGVALDDGSRIGRTIEIALRDGRRATLFIFERPQRPLDASLRRAADAVHPKAECRYGNRKQAPQGVLEPEATRCTTYW